MIKGLAERFRGIFKKTAAPAALQRCSALWGEAVIRTGAPELHLVENAVYIPWSHGGPWGVFDSGDKVVPQAVNHRLPENRVSGPTPGFPTSLPAQMDYLDSALYIGFINVHYGHFIIESVPRLWPLLEGSQKDLPVICHTRGFIEDWARYPFIGSIFDSLGTSAVRVPERPVRIRRLLVANASMQEQAWAFPVFLTLCKQIGRPFWDISEVDSDRTPLYLSKSKLAIGIGRLAQEDVIEAAVRAAGFDVAHPETMSFAEQVGMMARRRTVLATAGSSLHTSIFSAPRRRIRALNLSGFINSNYTIIDKLNQNDALYLLPHFSHAGEGGGFNKTYHMTDPLAVARELIALARR